MDTATELNVWHIQCIHSPLKTTRAISRYIQNVDTFLDRVWEESEEAAVIPPQLEVDDVENSVVTHRGTSINVVRIRFKLPPKHKGDNDAFHSAIRHFCERIFKLKTEGEICSDIGLISPRFLVGIAPLSKWFRVYWTQGFLETFVRRQVPLFDEVADAEFFWPWLGGAAFVVLASDQKSSDILRGIKISLAKSFAFEARRPPQELEKKSKRLSNRFLRSVEKLLRKLDKTTEACTTAINEGAAQLPSDHEVELFNAVLEVFENGFETLTANKEVFDEWQNIVSDAAARLGPACFATSVSLGVFGWKATAAVMATKAAAGGAVGGAALCSAMCSAAVLGPLALLVAGSLICYLHYRNYNKAKKESKKIKKLSEGIRGYHDIARYLAQWFVKGHQPAQADEPQEMQDMRTQLDTEGLMPPFSLRDYNASLSSEADVIRQQLRKMKQDPELKDYFS
ncbi:hypothetical protein CEP54_007142 [Fusarium duplospermum]|uniref:Uncharacterized protein n=1 Tax=Fusarium duplospermum TaxID=1325734 RepID=A0A428Q352_9HYPO|nr:hypothetical protein CEP54_007142 [Fusarium duplospermum]